MPLAASSTSTSMVRARAIAAGPCARRRSSAALASPLQPRTPPRGRLLLRRTSEHWYDDELEYDAVREILDPKRVVIATVGGGGASASSSSATPPATATATTTSQIPRLRYAVGFCSSQAQEAAEEVWEEELGRAGPPLFLKVRRRAALEELESAASASRGVAATAAEAADAAEAFWSELAGQNWRTELDYGLGMGGEATSAPEAPREEPVLVVVATAAAARALARHACGEQAAAAAAGDAPLIEIVLEGWNQDPDPDRHQPLGEWRECLRPSCKQKE